MKKVFSFFLILCIFFSLSPAVLSEGENRDTPAGWNVRIPVPEGAIPVLQGSEYYLYAQQEGSIPYVMLKTYRADDAAAFLDAFTAFMKEQYPDLQILSGAHSVSYGGKNGLEIDYSYQVSGFEVCDRRIVLVTDGVAYLFTSKEISELGMTVGSMLEDVVASCELISDADSGQDPGLSDGYLYCDENGIPRYWLDFSRIVEDNLVLHCWLPSGETAFSESCFVLDLSSAEVTENGLRIRQVHSLQGDDCTERFGNLTLRFYLDAAVMTAEPHGKAPEGGPEDQIPTGNYVMTPVGVAAGPGEKQSHIRPPGDGPYQPEELAKWAQIYCFRKTGSFLPEAEAAGHPDGTYTVMLYDTADSGGGADGGVRYTVDAYGEGHDDRTGETVSLMR